MRQSHERDQPSRNAMISSTNFGGGEKYGKCLNMVFFKLNTSKPWNHPKFWWSLLFENTKRASQIPPNKIKERNGEKGEADLFAYKASLFRVIRGKRWWKEFSPRLFFCRSAWLDKTQANRVESVRDRLALEMSDSADNDTKKVENRAT